MPYITRDAREALTRRVAENPGELNYEITTLLRSYQFKKGLNYQTINDILGALEASKTEFYRRVVIPYETSKIAENGDVYL